MLATKLKLSKIPDLLVHDLPQIEAFAIKKCVNTEMLIYEIDTYGYLWIKLISVDNDDGYQAQSFALEPRNVLKI